VTPGGTNLQKKEELFAQLQKKLYLCSRFLQKNAVWQYLRAYFACFKQVNITNKQ
jgi:hypothetical protein